MSYQERFKHAYELAGSPPRKDLASAAGISVQAIGQLLSGETKTLKTEQSAKAADFMDVDHYWLATGEGKPRPDRAWPFDLFGPDEYQLIPVDYRNRVENELAGEVQRVKRLGNGTTG